MTIDHLREEIQNADMVVVGIGAELEACKVLSYDAEEIREFFKSKGYKKYDFLVERAGDDEEIAYLRELYYFYYILNHETKWDSIYNTLSELLKEKNYFVITSNADDLIYTSKLKKDRITAPCGTHHYFQCKAGCSQTLYPSMELLEAKILEFETTGEKSKIACGKCKAPLEFNIRTKETASHYVEQAYLPQWNNYTKWLQGTLHKNFLVLELGEGFEQPSLFHWPFERMVYFNENAKLIRVHEKLSQVGKELNGKAESVAVNARKFLEG